MVMGVLWARPVGKGQFLLCRASHMSSPSWTFLPPPTPSHPLEVVTEHRIWVPSSYSKFPLAVYFTYGNAYSLNSTLSIRPTLSFPHCVHKCVLYVCISKGLSLRFPRGSFPEALLCCFLTMHFPGQSLTLSGSLHTPSGGITLPL